MMVAATTRHDHDYDHTHHVAPLTTVMPPNPVIMSRPYLVDSALNATKGTSHSTSHGHIGTAGREVVLEVAPVVDVVVVVVVVVVVAVTCWNWCEWLAGDELGRWRSTCGKVG